MPGAGDCGDNTRHRRRDNDRLFRAGVRRLSTSKSAARALPATRGLPCAKLQSCASSLFAPEYQQPHKITIIYMLKAAGEGCRGRLSLSRPSSGQPGASFVVPVVETVCGRHARGRGVVADLKHQNIRTLLLRALCLDMAGPGWRPVPLPCLAR